MSTSDFHQQCQTNLKKYWSCQGIEKFVEDLDMRFLQATSNGETQIMFSVTEPFEYSNLQRYIRLRNLTSQEYSRHNELDICLKLKDEQSSK
jgi:hypothetical protein